MKYRYVSFFCHVNVSAFCPIKVAQTIQTGKFFLFVYFVEQINISFLSLVECNI